MLPVKYSAGNMLRTFCSIALIALAFSCNNKDKVKQPVEEPTVIYKKDSDTLTKEKKKKSPPIINITDTVALKQLVLYVKDSASSSERIGKKMTNIYNKILADAIKLNKLKKTGPRMAWYRSSSAPFFFEAGVPVDKKPAKLPKKVFLKTMDADSIVVAHFYGPYYLTSQGYEALGDWMQSNNKKSAGAPYEIYVDNPFDSNGKAIDPYKVRTDIIFPYK